MVKILFICHGNICRSPMAEFLLKDLAEKAGIGDRLEIASAAVSREELGNPVYPPARRELQRHGISCAGKTARQITLADCRYYDRIYYMDRSNAWYLARMFPEYTGKFRPLLDREVADPWYTGDFRRTWDDLAEGCGQIIGELIPQHDKAAGAEPALF